MKKIKRETENKEEHSPHTPHKEKQEGEREGGWVAVSTHVRPRVRAHVKVEAFRSIFPTCQDKLTKFLHSPPTPEILHRWCSNFGITDLEWADSLLEATLAIGWVDENNNQILNWPRYFIVAYKNHTGKRISNKGRKTAKGAYKRLSGDDKTMFDAFWNAYPTRRRTEKDKCADLLMRILAENGTDKVSMFNRLMDGLDKWKQSYDWTKQSGEFVMMPYRWLFNECWDTPPQGGCPTERRRGVSQTANVKLSEDQFGW